MNHAETFLRWRADAPLESLNEDDIRTFLLAAGHVAIWLLDHGLADSATVGAFITPAIMVDILSQLVDHLDVLCGSSSPVTSSR